MLVGSPPTTVLVVTLVMVKKPCAVVKVRSTATSLPPHVNWVSAGQPYTGNSRKAEHEGGAAPLMQIRNGSAGIAVALARLQLAERGTDAHAAAVKRARAARDVARENARAERKRVADRKAAARAVKAAAELRKVGAAG